MAKVDCAKCGKPINEEIFRKHIGMCENCFKELVAIHHGNIIRRVNWLCQNPQPIIQRLDNGEPICAFYLPTMVRKIYEVESGKPNVKKFMFEFDLGQIRFNRVDNFVGMGGFYYNPQYYWGENIQNVINAWNWFIERTLLKEEAFLEALEHEILWETLLTGRFEGITCDIITLVVDLYALNLLMVDVSPKISEISNQIRGHMEKYERMSRRKEFGFSVKAVGEAFFRVRNLQLFLNHLSAESRLARLAKIYGFDVKLNTHPDMTINGKNVEVKKVKVKYILPKKRESFLTFVSTESIATENLSNPIEEGLKQDADIIAIEVHHLEQRNIKGYKATWLGKESLEEVLANAVTSGKKGLVMLFSSTSEGNFGRIILVKKKVNN